MIVCHCRMLAGVTVNSAVTPVDHLFVLVDRDPGLVTDPQRRLVFQVLLALPVRAEKVTDTTSGWRSSSRNCDSTR
jgi:hypothetical protein